MKASLTPRAAAPTPAKLYFLTRNAQPVVDGDRANPVHAVLWGLGRTLALEHPEIWGGVIDVDVDGDGVLDFVVAVSGSSHGAASSDASRHEHSRACQGVALAGVPPREPLWNVSICGGNGVGSGVGGGDPRQRRLGLHFCSELSHLCNRLARFKLLAQETPSLQPHASLSLSLSLSLSRSLSRAPPFPSLA